MTESEILIGLTEVSIGIIGFSGLLYVLSPAEQHRTSTSANLIAMLGNAVLVVIHSLFGIFLHVSIEDPWGWASVFASVTYIAGAPIIILLISNVIDDYSDYSDVPKWFQATTWLPSLGALGVHVCNTPIFEIQNFGLFLLGQGMLLVTAIILFMYMVVTLVSKKGGT